MNIFLRLFCSKLDKLKSQKPQKIVNTQILRKNQFAVKTVPNVVLNEAAYDVNKSSHVGLTGTSRRACLAHIVGFLGCRMVTMDMSVSLAQVQDHHNEVRMSVGINVIHNMFI